MIADYYIAADNGLEGAVVAIYGSTGDIAWMLPMPIRNRKVDSIQLMQCLRSHIPCLSVIKIVIEACPKHAPAMNSMRSMGINWGKLEAVFELAFPTAEITSVRPGNSEDSWQTAMLGKLPKGQTKKAALAVAKELYPDQVWPMLCTKGKKRLHDGVLDAVLMARHRRNLDLQKTNQ